MTNTKQRNAFGKFTSEIRQSGICQKLTERDDFITTSTVEIFNRHIIDHATNHIYSNLMIGKARRRVIDPENLFIFDFECEEDAIAFRLKYCGV